MIEFPADPVTGQTEVIDGIKWICQVGATGDNADPDNVVWVRQGNALSEAQPIGSFINFGGTVAPAGYLVCDGSEVSQTTYADLFAAIGTAWNTTAGAAPPVGGNFRLPPQNVDGLGLFMRGDGSGTVVGEYQADVFKEHDHPVGASTSLLVTNNNASVLVTGGSGDFLATSTTLPPNTGDPTETRPRSITTLLCIKATYSAFTGDLGNLPVNSVGTAQIQTDAVKEDELDVSALQVAGLLPVAHAFFNGTNATLLSTGLNVASITRVGLGSYDVTLSSPLSSVNASVVAATWNETNVVTAAWMFSTSVIRIKVQDWTGGSAQDSDGVSVQVFGGRT